MIRNIKLFTINKGVIGPLLILLAISSPSKELSLLLLFPLLLHIMVKISVDKLKLFVVITILFINALITVYLNGLSFLVNYAIFVLFISPLLVFIITKDSSYLRFNSKNLKYVIEYYLIIQIAFGVLGVIYRLLLGYSLDVDFGDIVAGTFRNPISYKPDASNVIFVFTMLLSLFVYVNAFNKTFNKAIAFIGFIIVFLASVNHLILAIAVSAMVSVFWRSPIKTIILFCIVILLFMQFQPANFELLKVRIVLLLKAIINPENLIELGLKGEYLFNFITNIIELPQYYLTFGIGGGAYSSRASLFCTGEYVSSFPFRNISEFSYENTYPLWQKLVDAPPWLAGSFNYPYSSITSFIAEIGFLGSIIIWYLVVRKIRETKLFSIHNRRFFLVFLLLAGLVDNYYEYYQATFIFVYLILLAQGALKYRTRHV